MNPIRLPHAKTLLLASASAAVLMLSQAAHARPLSESVLVGGSTGNAINPTSPIPGLPSVVSTQAQAQAQQARTTANLADAAARIQAALTAQTNARAAAQAAPSSVPNGLAAGGLNPDSGLAANGTANPVLTWVGADTPTQAAANGQTTVTVNQTQQAAILNWQTFNVGKQTTVNFIQKDSTGADQTSWVALNKVNDPNAKPSQIAGQITAPGSVYIVNRNGVIFTGTSQINVHSLIAAATDFDNTQFLTNGIYSTQTAGSYNPVFANAGGDVTVQAGAQITTATPSSVTAGGGFVMLLGQNVENDGAITTPVGQTLLAAGDNFILRPGYSTDGSNPSSTTNGSEIATVENTNGDWIPGGTGSVTNKGYIYSPEGDITLAGHTITQDGTAVSTTSVATRGTIHLLNSASDTTGSITIGANALTDVMPELDSTATALNAQRAGLGIPPSNLDFRPNPQFDNLDSELALTDSRYQSRIDLITGGTAELQGGSLTLANAGQINVVASQRTQIDKGASLDVSGVNVTLPASVNALAVNIQGNEERDDPNNRDDGALFNEDVYVDERDLIYVPAGTGGYPSDRYYTAGGLLEVSGELANVGHTEGEWASVAGSVTLGTASTGAVVVQSGANINLEGGSIAYQGGYVPTTWLRASDGSIVNINQAPADKTYVGLANSFQVDHTRWVVSDNFSGGFFAGSTIYEPGYVVGRDAGTLTIASPTVLFSGTIDADVIAGTQQIDARPATAIDPFLETQTTTPLPAIFVLGPMPQAAGILPVSQVEFGGGTDEGNSLGIADAVPTAFVNTMDLNADALSSFGLGGITAEVQQFGSTSPATLTVDAPLTLAPGGHLTLNAEAISINSNITAHGGAITGLTDGSTETGQNIIIAPGVTLDTTGLWTNAQLDPYDLGGLAYLNGGPISLTASGDVTLGAGSLLDASSGAAILQNGKIEGGAGGDITLITNYNGTEGPLAGIGNLLLDGSIRSYGVTKGGQLTIQASSVIIGDSALVNGTILPAGAAAPTNLVLGFDVELPAGTVRSAPTTLASSLQYSAGEVAPLPTEIEQAVTFAAGTTVPVPVLASTRPYQPGQPLPDAEITPSSGQPIVLAAAWTIPSNASDVFYDVTGTIPYYAGSTVPAGTQLYPGYGQLPAGYVIPVNVFPGGWGAGTETTYAAGAILPAQVTMPVGSTWAAGVPLLVAAQIAAGTVIPPGPLPVATTLRAVGDVSPVDLNVGTLSLQPAFFQQGFSSYSANGVLGLDVTDGTQINATMPIYRFTPESRAVSTGSDPATALDIWTPPLYLVDPQTATITQRAGVSVSLLAMPAQPDGQARLQSQSVSGPTLAPLTVGAGATISVDPGQSININGWGEVDIEGALRAPGGTINILNTRPFQLVEAAADPALSIWIGNDAVVDTSGNAITALDQNGRSFGLVRNGGSITLGSASDSFGYEGALTSSDAFIVIRPGALISADGARATIDLSAGMSANTPSDQVLDASDGGTIALSSYSGLYVDGDLTATAGGSGAAGGSLSLTLVTPVYRGTATDYGRQERDITIDPNSQTSGLTNASAPGNADPALQIGFAHIGVDQIANGGFGSLALRGGDDVVFNGDVDLNLSQSLSISQATLALASNTPNAQVTLSAPYVSLTGNVGMVYNSNSGDISFLAATPSQTTANGTLTINADQIDIRNQLSFSGANNVITLTSGSTLPPVDLPGFSLVSLNSTGDIRFLADNDTYHTGVYTGLASEGNFEFSAARIYPATGVAAYVSAGLTPAMQSNGFQSSLSPTGTITINAVPGSDPTPPDSAFGNLTLTAGDIEQGGVVMAPLGAITLDANTDDFLPGSITSVSAKGLVMPYGGTSDGLTYLYDGTAVSYIDPFNNIIVSLPAQFNTAVNSSQGILLKSQSINIEPGSLIDISGGGDLTGEGFITGRGGSIDVLGSALINANPANKFSNAGDKVYAIVPGYQSAYAPVAPDAGAGNPGVGQQVKIGAGVPGLAAGTYTLLPSIYALLPGAFRVEVGGSSVNPSATGKLVDGSFLAAGQLGTANSNVLHAVPTSLILTPADTVRTYSQYNETGYADFALKQAATFGTPLPLLPMDAKLLVMQFGATLGTGSPLTTGGSLDVAPATDASGDTGKIGTLQILEEIGDTDANGQTIVPPPIEIRRPDQAPTPGTLSLDANSLDALGLGVFMIGQTSEVVSPGSSGTQASGLVTIYGGNSGVTVRSGASLAAAQIFLTSDMGNVTLEDGAKLSTIGKGAAPWDSALDDLVFQFDGIGLSNGAINLLSGIPGLGSQTAISIGANSQLLAEGTIAIGIPYGVAGPTIDPTARFGAKNLSLAMSTVNVGTTDTLAGAQNAGILPVGWSLTPEALAALSSGDATAGVPGLQSFDLTVTNALNFFGTVDLSTIDPATGKSNTSLVLNTPAIYGYGGANDVASITTDGLVWSGIATNIAQSNQPPNYVPTTPPSPTPGGAGSGSGTLNIIANNITFGYGSDTQTQDATAVPRQTLGFATVNLEAAQQISANNAGTLAVYQDDGDHATGTLNLVTPLLTAGAGANMAFTAGHAINVTLPSGATPATTANVNALGAEIDLTSGSVSLDSAVALPSGKFAVNAAAGDILLGANADIDVSGRAVPMFDLTEYSWGGDVTLGSAQGNVAQATGSVIDVSAVNNNAGSLTVQAVTDGAGKVTLDGTVLGAATPGFQGGQITISAQTLDNGALSDGFGALNAMLNAGGVNGARSFDFKSGDLTINDTVTAQNLGISVDNGSLTVNGTLDASGAAPGTIRLAAQNDLTLSPTAVLDAHGTVLQTDSYGASIDAENRAHVELAAVQGMLTLSPGAIIDMRVTDPRNVDANGNQIVNYGDLELDAHRTGETSGDINISAPLDASGRGVTILGAGTIALNGFWNYQPTGANSNTIVQDNGLTTPIAPESDTTTTTTTLEALSITTTVTTTKTLTVTDQAGVSLPETVTFTSVPTPNTAIGERAGGNFFYFPNYCGAYCSSATVVSGMVTDNVTGHVFSPTNQGGKIGYFSGFGAGTTFAAGTKIMVTGVNGGTTLFNITSTQTLSNATTTTPVVPGTPVGTTTSTVTNPDGSQTVTTNVVASTNTLLSTVVSHAAEGTLDGTVVTTNLTPDGFGTLITNAQTVADPGSGFIGLNQIDTQSQAFMTAAQTNTDLASRVTGLAGYGSSFHVRPGVEIDSGPSGTLTTQGDLDFSGFRYSDAAGYGTQVNPGIYGSGEPGMVVIRAAGDLTINGSISDGFAPALPVGYYTTTTVSLESGFQAEAGTAFPTTVTIKTSLSGSVNGAIGESATAGYFYFPGFCGHFCSNATVISGQVVDNSEGVTFSPGQQIGYFSTRGAGTTFAAGTVIELSGIASGTSLFSAENSKVLSNSSVPAIPGTPTGTGTTTVNNADGSQTITTVTTVDQSINGMTSIPALSPMLAPGSLSWNMRLVSGADLKAADTRTVLPKGVLDPTAIPAVTAPLYSGVAIPTTMTFTALPIPTVGTSQHVNGNYFYFGGYFQVTAGEVDLPSGRVIRPGYTFGYFPKGTVFQAGTTITFGTQAAGTLGFVAVVSPAVPAKGNLVLAGNYVSGDDSFQPAPGIEVVRTGTGFLDLLAGESFSQQGLYGVYTAGSQSANIDSAYQLPRATLSDGSLLGAGNDGYSAADASYQAYYPTGGGDVLLKAQGDISGWYQGSTDNFGANSKTDWSTNGIGNWLWRQGGTGIGQQTAWWINFGSYSNLITDNGGALYSRSPIMTGFTGIGTLGGGNLTVIAGGDAGLIDPVPTSGNNILADTALTLAVGGSGRVSPDGTLTQTGGGRLILDVGGAFNPFAASTGGYDLNDAQGIITDVRGDVLIKAASIGIMTPTYSSGNGDDPRAANPLAATYQYFDGGPELVPGDSRMTVETRGDLVLGGAGDPGRQPLENATLATNATGTGSALSWFTLWTPDSGIDLFSAGGNIAPANLSDGGGEGIGGADQVTDSLYFIYPPNFSAVAAGGSIYAGFAAQNSNNVGFRPIVELAPSPTGQLQLLAEDSIYDDGNHTSSGTLIWTMSSADPSTEATPFNPGYALQAPFGLPDPSNPYGAAAILDTNYWTNNGVGYRTLYTFGPDTVTSNIRANDYQPARFYAVTGDISQLIVGDYYDYSPDNTNTAFQYLPIKPVDVQAGGDIVDFGSPYQSSFVGTQVADFGSFIMNTRPGDVSVVSAGGDIYYANALVAGPGTLEVTAGGNIYQGDHGLIESIGPIYGFDPQNHIGGGANVLVLAGLGKDGPDWTDFANLYLNSANTADTSLPLDFPQNQGKVVETYQDDLYAWLKTTYGYAGTEAGALAYFLSLPTKEQSVFDLKVYFNELDQSDVEFNDPSDRLFKSYVRGRTAIATLFPTTDAAGNTITYDGGLTLASGYEMGLPNTFSNVNTLWDSGIRTEFGGDLDIVSAGGQAIIGAQSVLPGPDTGVLTEGSGDVNIYADGSVPLGLSRVFTTFGGNITIWSATGDINAGRGSKGTVVFAPSRREYDAFGNVALSPTVPSSGAGIATLAPISEVPPGNIYLIAPLGTIDAGEAGIRVSGNAYLAALQVVNAANIQVKGQAFGLPPKPVTNLSLTTASNAATEAAQMVRNIAAHRDSVVTVEVTGFGSECVPSADAPCPPAQ